MIRDLRSDIKLRCEKALEPSSKVRRTAPFLFALRKFPRVLPTDDHTRILTRYNSLPTNASRSTL